ncbi:MAG TPA: CBS domain-containing protein [Polyangia bacterium]|nr:CBS domain-containing protein [Polyangia bacterium]
MTKTTIRHYMTPTPHTIGAEQMLTVAIELMREHKIRHLPVLRGGRLVGILSERDVALISGLPTVDPAVVPVEDAMSEEVYTVAGDTPLDEVAATMAANKYGSALVVDPRNHIVGVFTTIDALHALADGAPVRKRAAAH